MGIGNASTIESRVPVYVNFTWPGTITHVVAGYFYSMVVVENKYLYVFGDNRRGQLCDGTLINKYSPTLLNLNDIMNPAVHSIEDIALGGMTNFRLSHHCRCTRSAAKIRWQSVHLRKQQVWAAWSQNRCSML